MKTKISGRMLGELDEPFMTAIMPELVEVCKALPFDCLPDRSQLLTVIDLIQRQVKGDRTEPVPIALTFGLHAALISISVLQGNGNLARIAANTKESSRKNGNRVGSQQSTRKLSKIVHQCRDI